MSLSMTTLLLDAMFESWFVDALNRSGSSPSILDCLHKGDSVSWWEADLHEKLKRVSSTIIYCGFILVTQIQLPVSTIHALIGSLLGVGIADDPRNVNQTLLFKFMCGWVMTIIFCFGVAYVIFTVSIHSPAYVVR